WSSLTRPATARGRKIFEISFAHKGFRPRSGPETVGAPWLTSGMDQPFDLTSYDASHTLASLVEDRRTADRSEADLLAKVVHFCDLHPVIGPDDEAATWPTDQ